MNVKQEFTYKTIKRLHSKAKPYPLFSGYVNIPNSLIIANMAYDGIKINKQEFESIILELKNQGLIDFKNDADGWYKYKLK